MMEVRLYGRRVGTLSGATTEPLSFQYDEAYATNGSNPPLSNALPLTTHPYGEQATFAWFDALLPESTRREHLARLVNAPSVKTWDLLYAVGGECAGAVQTIGEGHREAVPSYTKLSERELHLLLSQTTVEPLRTFGNHARISLAGAQEKAALQRELDGSWSVPLGGAPSSHILKPESARFPGLVENEHLCMTLARYAGLETAHTHIETVRGIKVLVVERYDRARRAPGTIERVHQEDFTQALGTTEKYQSDGGPSAYALFSVSGIERDKLFDAFMYNWLIGNCDAHAKNYSVLEPGTERSRLAPLYDALSTEAYPNLDKTLAVHVARAKHINAVNARAVDALGQRIGYPGDEARERLQSLAERVSDALGRYADENIAPTTVRTDFIFARCEQACEWARESTVERTRT